MLPISRVRSSSRANEQNGRWPVWLLHLKYSALCIRFNVQCWHFSCKKCFLIFLHFLQRHLKIFVLGFILFFVYFNHSFKLSFKSGALPSLCKASFPGITQSLTHTQPSHDALWHIDGVDDDVVVGRHMVRGFILLSLDTPSRDHRDVKLDRVKSHTLTPQFWEKLRFSFKCSAAVALIDVAEINQGHFRLR